MVRSGGGSNVEVTIPPSTSRGACSCRNWRCLQDRWLSKALAAVDCNSVSVTSASYRICVLGQQLCEVLLGFTTKQHFAREACLSAYQVVYAARAWAQLSDENHFRAS